MAIAKDADVWASSRVGIFFPADTDNTLRDGNLTGQCVSLNKWFLAEMTSVPSPGIARGHAKDVGDRLVAQGHAVQVAESQRKRGDFVVWKQDGGGYGHIGVLLSGDRVFEQNVGLAGTPTRRVNANTPQQPVWITVYSARIDPLYQSWRKGSPTFYRIKTYNENNPTPTPTPGGNSTMNENDLNHIYQYGPLRRTRVGSEGNDVYLGKSASFVIADHRDSKEGKARAAELTNAINQAGRVPTLEKQASDLASEKDKLSKENADLKAQVKKLQEEATSGGDSGEFTKILSSGSDLYIKK